MTPERWRKIEDIYQAALDLSGDERDGFVRRECGNDDQARREIEKLIADSETGSGFLESPIWTDSRFLQSQIKKEIAASLEDEISPAASAKRFIGRRIGVYRLTRELGKGGMGEVFLAERADGEFNQKVAIKLIKRGMDTDFIVKRFRHERQIAATLNHPNIARLLDGGTTEDDLPYFVMEYVEGVSFFKYAETNELDLRGKLELFLRVCAAVAHAHKRKIIHRDIKPGNILVSEDGEPKLLDFGIAKILDPDLIHESVLPTATQMRLMTPEYASPEQVRGDEVTTASDQYSLGVLLYELITGQRPYKFSSRAPHEIARVICEELPGEPSSGAFGQTISDSAETLLFGVDYCRKLDRIVLKSLRKNHAERYASVEEFARDIERFLKGETVRAEFIADEKINEKSVNETDVNSQTRATAEQKSIAVLPLRFLNRISGENTTGEFLSIGLADAIITRLSNLRRLLVRPTSSVLRYSASDTDSFAAGAELQVGFLLDGSILKYGNRIRVSVQLLNVAEKSTVWAERLDEDFTDVLTLEDTISKRVAESLLPQLSANEAENLARRATDEPAAYEAYLRGRFHWNQFTEESLKQAIFFYREAVRLDPNYALAYAGIADYFIWLGIFGVLPGEQTFQKAKETARTAIEIDDRLAEAYAALGFAELCSDFDWREGEKNIRRAIEINPNYAVAHNWLAFLLATAARFDESVKHAEKAIELDSLTYQNYRTLAWSYYFSRRFGEALATMTRAIEKFPLTGIAHANRSWFLRTMNRSAESLDDSETALKTVGSSLFVQIGHAQALAADRKLNEAEALIARLEANPAVRYISRYQVALVYAYADEREKAVESLEQAAAESDGWLVWLNVEPALDNLRGDERFETLLRRINPPNLKPTPKFVPLDAANALVPKSAPDFSAGESPKSIAVLPFKILNALTDQDTGDMTFLGIGLADALISRLSNVRQFVVRPTSSVLRFNDAAADSIRAGRELNVEFILEGNILKINSRIRVSVQLLNVAENSTVWAERFDEKSIDVLTLEDSISSRVAESLMPQLSTGDRLKLAKRGTDQPKAYEAYLRGRFYWNTFTEESFAKAFVAYHEAISYDANYALAYAGIADYYIWLGVYGVVSPPDCYPPAKEAARRAIELDDGLSDAYAALGFAELCGDFDLTEAEKNVVRAIEINPNHTVARLWYSYVLQTAGRFDKGIAEARRAVELDPLTYTNHHVLAWAFYFARRFDEAVAQAAANVEKFPGIGLAYFTQSWILRFLGRHEESLNVSQRAIELSGDSLFVLLGHAQALAAAGKKSETGAALQRIFEQGTRQYLSYYQVALVYAYENENAKALDALERAFEEREGWLIWLGVEPALDKLRSEPRFVNLRGKVDGQPIGAESEAAALPEKSGTDQKPNSVIPSDEAKTNSNAPESNRAALFALRYVLAPVILAVLAYCLYHLIY